MSVPPSPLEYSAVSDSDLLGEFLRDPFHELVTFGDVHCPADKARREVVVKGQPKKVAGRLHAAIHQVVRHPGTRLTCALETEPAVLRVVHSVALLKRMDASKRSFVSYFAVSSANDSAPSCGWLAKALS